VERIVDGDTLAVRVRVWLGQEVAVLLRLAGIDAPELRGGCDAERAAALAARDALAALVTGGEIVLTAIEGDKYFGRVVAVAVTPAGADLAALLLASGHARAYDGGTRQGWCAADESEAVVETGTDAAAAQIAARAE
jgi:endonuclease YncB( thermonuclease family)